MTVNYESRKTKKQLILFLIICLPVSWLLTALPMILDKPMETSPGLYALYTLACYMPAIAALVTCIITKESIRSLKVLPKLQGNGKVYGAAILSAVIISIFDTPLIIILFFPKVGSWNPEVTVTMVIFQYLRKI